VDDAIGPLLEDVVVAAGGYSQPGITLGLSDALDGLDVLPGFTFPLAELFA
jgi:hypothetical protein